MSSHQALSLQAARSHTTESNQMLRVRNALKRIREAHRDLLMQNAMLAYLAMASPLDTPAKPVQEPKKDWRDLAGSFDIAG